MIRSTFVATAAVLALVGCNGGADDTNDDTDTTTDTFGFDSAEEIGPDGNDSIADAEDLGDLDVEPVEYGGTIGDFQILVGDGLIAPEGDRDFYSIGLTGGTTYIFVALSYYYEGQIILDTVLRIYDSDGNELAANDDMPFRFIETDSAMYFSAPEDGTYYLEVLDYRDWVNTPPLSGGGDHTYELRVGVLPNTEVDPNDTLVDVFINGAGDPPPADTDLDDTSDDSADSADDTAADDTDVFVPDTDVEDTGFVNYNLTGRYTPNPFRNPDFGGFFDFTGTFGTANDVDWWPYQVLLTEPDDEFAFVTWTAWNTAYIGRTPKVTVYDQDGFKLASSAKLEEDIEKISLRFDDPGIMVKANHGDVLYLKFEETDGLFGIEKSYPMFTLPRDNNTADLENEDRGNDSTSDYVDMTFEQFPNDQGSYFANIWGELPVGDEVDVFRIAGGNTGGLAGKFLSIAVQAEGIGSELDPKVTLYGADGTTVLGEYSEYEYTNRAGDMVIELDPVVRNLPVGSDETIFVEMSYDDRTDALKAQHYHVIAIVTPDNFFVDP